MKTLYLAYTELNVYGCSWNNADEAKQNALNWWKSENEPPAKWDEIKILELNVNDSVTDYDFISCSQVHEYKQVAEEL